MAYIRKAFLDLDIGKIDNAEILENEISFGRWLFDALLLIMQDDESCDLQKLLDIGHKDFRFIPDFYLEKGCKSLNIFGRTILEIKKNLLIDTEIKQAEIYRTLKDGNVVDKIILLYINPTYSIIDNSGLGGRVDFINANSFIEIIKKAIIAGKGDVLKQLRLGEKYKSRRWIETRKERLENAINDLKRYDSAIFLGAGVSVSANMPSWDGLLKELMGRGQIIDQSDYKAIAFEMDNSNLIIARYIQKSLGIDDNELRNRIWNMFYKKGNVGESDLISSICNLVNNQKNVRSILTYNYDTFIEENLKINGKSCFSVYGYNRDEYNSFPVYHVHGYISRENKKQEDDRIVLNEKDYHEMYSKVFDWSNVEQLHALTRCTCFFIGLSMKDPNLRRLLEIANGYRGNEARHYVFLERKSKFRTKEKREEDFQIREDILADLGINVIWYSGRNNHKQLPRLLQYLAEKQK
jgi:hypothetical protein